MVDLDSFCKDMVESVFPDVQGLREKCIAAGRIPMQHRGEVWCLFLSGTIICDDELAKDSGPVQSVFDYDRWGNGPDVERQLKDILSLFCKRMNCEYSEYMTYILAPLLISNSPMSPSVAFSCFYSLCTSYMPLNGYHLDDMSSRSALELKQNNMVIAKQTTWLRLLVGYHFPKLLLHLDSVFPDWEKLWIDTHTREAEGTTRTGSGGGLIPTAWLSALFAGTLLRPDAMLVLWDWCLLWEGQTAAAIAVFLTAALLGLCEEALLAMTSAEQMCEWSRTMCQGGLDAFRQAHFFGAVSAARTGWESGNTAEMMGEADGALEFEGDECTEDEDDYDDDDDDDDFALDPSASHRGEQSMSLVRLKETAVGCSTAREGAPNGSGRRRHQNVSSFFMGGIDDDGHTGGDDSFVSTGTESDLSPMKSARQGSGSPFSRPNVGAVTGHGQRETEEEVYQSCEHGSGETITQLHFDSYSPLASDQERITETSFLWGWLSCTALLARNTPTSFKVAMGRVEDWAAVAAKAELLAQRTLEESTCERGGGVGEQSLADHKAGYEDSEESEGERVDVDMDSTEADMAGLVAPYEDSVEMAYHEESVRRAREREGTDEDEVEDLLGDSKAMNSATQTLSGWSRGLTAGISVMANMALPANTVAGGKQHKSAVQLEAASKALQVSLRYPLHGRADRACLFTTADEVLPCVCSPRRRSDMSSSMAFQTTFVRNASVEGRAERPFPCPLTDKLAVDESPFFFAIDCWPEDMTMTGANALSSRLFRIPKALQLPYTTVMDAMAMDEMLQVLEPLSQSVHFVLIGKGLDIIRFQHNLKCDGPLDVCQAGEDAQLAAMAMALMKRGFPHVSLLEGGAGELLRFLWRCEGRTVESSHNSDNCTGSELGLHALVDVDHDEIDRLFAYLTGTQPPHEQSSTSTSLANKITTASVTDMLSSSMNTTYNLFRRR